MHVYDRRVQFDKYGVAALRPVFRSSAPASTDSQRMISVQNFKASRRYVINPEESVWLRRWEAMMVVALFFVCFVTPYEVAFLANDKDPDWLMQGADSLFWINRVIDLIFVLDMTMQFFTMYPVVRRFGSFFVSDQKAIVLHYLRGWFIVDFISVLPFELVGIVASSENVAKLKALRAVRLLRLLKLIRLFRGFRIFVRWEVEMAISYRKMTLWGLLATVCMSAHWMSCALGLLDSIQGETCFEAPDDAPDCVVTWFTSFAKDMSIRGKDISSFSAYLAALHITATILVHPYQAAATSEAEQVCFTMLVFLGGLIWTRVISRTTAVQTSLDRHGIFYRQTMDDLNLNIDDLTLSVPLQKRLRAFFRNMRDTSQRSTWSELMKRMSPALQTEVSVELHKVWLRRVPFLVGSSHFLIADVAQRIQTEHFAQRETFGSNFRLYVMNRGLCSRVIGWHHRLKLFLPGAVWGMEHLVFHTAQLLEPNTSTTITFCEVLVFTRESFEQVKIDWPENNQRIRKFYVKMAIIRGIIKYAKEKIFQDQATKTIRRMTSSMELGELASAEGSLAEEEEAGFGEHATHVRRMQRDMSRRLPEQSRSTGTNWMNERRVAESHVHSSDLAPAPADTLTLSALEEKLSQRIEKGFSALQRNLEDFKREIRKDLEEAGVVSPKFEI